MTDEKIRKISLLLQPYQQIDDLDEFELENVQLSTETISTVTVQLPVIGTISPNTTIYADSRPFSTTYGMKINNAGTYNFRLPNEVGKWLWFRIVPPAPGQKYITKGRFNINSSVTLNTAELLPEN